MWCWVSSRLWHKYSRLFVYCHVTTTNINIFNVIDLHKQVHNGNQTHPKTMERVQLNRKPAVNFHKTCVHLK